MLNTALDVEDLSLFGDANPLASAVTLRDRDILSMVRSALVRREVLLAYQPVVDARNCRRIAFHEGLIRVIDDTGRIIPAEEFIGACEQHEVGRILDRVALEKGLMALAATPSLRLSINMSARSIGDAGWSETLEAGLRPDPTIAERLIIEVTESSAMSLPELTIMFMERQQKYGIAFALDDFGSGYTSFRYLRDFDFDIIKIAGEFVSGVAENADNRVLAQALVEIARHFDMFTVAEAVETEADARIMQTIGVDCMQGYFYGRPTTNPVWKSNPAPDRLRA